MSPQITFKSTETRAPQAAAPGEAVVDSVGNAIPPAPRLAEVVEQPYAPSHGRAPDRLPPRPIGFVDLGPAAALRVTGPEREKWLQVMQTADVAAAPYGGAVAASFLGGRGRLIAEALLWREREEVLITTLPERLEPLAAHLDKLLIMEDCEFLRAEGLWRLRYCPGPSPLGPSIPERITGSLQPLGLELLLPESEARALFELGVPRADPEAIEAWRIAVGFPVWGRELDEETTPLEAGLDRQISFSKGCYVGQEVVAMATYRGRVSWNLVRLQMTGSAPEAGAALDPARGGKKGKVTSSVAVGDLALLLGYVHKELIVPGSPVPLAGGRTATVLGLPYGSQPGAGQCV